MTKAEATAERIAHLTEVLQSVTDIEGLRRVNSRKDARELVKLDNKVRAALKHKTSPAAHVASARGIARRYRAHLVDGRGLGGITFGLSGVTLGLVFNYTKPLKGARWGSIVV